MTHLRRISIRLNGSDDLSNGNRGGPVGGDSGAALVLVLVFLLVVSLIVGALLTSSRNDIANAANFKAARSVQYDASSAVDLAIQNIRYKPQFSTTVNASPPAPCWGSVNSVYNASDGNSITVWCGTVFNPTSSATRLVTISACPTGLSAAACAAKPTLQAVATFNDYPAGLSAPTEAQCVVYCGSGFTLSSWVTFPVVPTVTYVGTTSGTISGGTPITIYGSGLNGATTVNFVKESGIGSSAKPTADNTVLTGTPTNVSSTSLSVTTPSTIWGDNYTYFVTVTTPSGTSAFNASSAVFTYQATVPTVSAITSVNNGPTTGGSPLQVKGAGFLNGATVSLAPVSSSGGATLTATDTKVLAPGLITAVTPAVTSAASYYVRVTTSRATSANTTNAEFTYGIQVPTVSSIGNSTTPYATTVSDQMGNPININGTGFTSDNTVSFQPEVQGKASGAAVNASFSLKSSTLIIATVPTLTFGNFYFVTVSNSKGSSSPFTVFSLI